MNGYRGAERRLGASFSRQVAIKAKGRRSSAVHHVDALRRVLERAHE